MTDRDLSEEWARSQLEAWADGSLTGESRERMAAALAADPSCEQPRSVPLPCSVRCARRRPRECRPGCAVDCSRFRPARVTFGAAFALPVTASVAAAFVAAVWLWPAPPPQEDPRVAAVAQDLELAMRYLQKSARITENEVTNAARLGFARRSRRDPRGGRTRDR